MKKLFLTMVLVAAVTAGYAVSAIAASETTVQIEEISGVMILKEDTDAREEPDTDAKKIITLKKGDSIFVTGKTENDWYRFVQNGKLAYVECTKVDNPGIDEELVKEMEEHVDMAIKDIDMINQYRKEAAKSKIWGSIIILLVVAVFAVGIITTLKKQKKEEKDKDRI